MKLTAKESTQKSQLFERLEEATKVLDDAVLNDEPEIAPLITTYNKIAGEVRTFVEDVANKLRNQVDSKSEKWLDSDKGNAADEFVIEWENFSIDDADEDGTFEDMTSEFDGLPEESDVS